MAISSKDSTGAAGAIYAHISARVMEQAIKQGIEAGVSSAVEYIEKEKKQARKAKADRRLHNTRLLLKSYRTLKGHTDGAVFNAKQAKERAIDILEGADEYAFDDNLYIESIKKSQQRTLIILRHIEQMLKYYRIDCEQSGRPEDLRRYRIIMAYYIDEERKSADEICSLEQIEKRTVYKDITNGIKPLTALIFGIDSIRFE